VVVYDVTSRASFDKVKNWMEEIKNNAHEKVTVILVGNKKDLKEKREVSREQGEKLARELKVMFIETCAFELPSVENLFEAIAEEVIMKIDSGKVDPSNEHVGIKKGNKQKAGQKSGSKTNTATGLTKATNDKKTNKCCKVN
jgi:GTPase SAR1 family protein